MSMGRRALLGLGAALVVVLVLAWALPRVAGLEIRVHDLELLPAGSAVGEADREIERRFGLDALLVVAFEARSFEVTDPRFAEDFALFVEELGTSRNISLFLVDRLYRPRLVASGDTADSALAATGGAASTLLRRPAPSWVEAALPAMKSVGVLGAGASRRAAFVELQSFSPDGIPDVEALVRRAAERVEAVRPGEYRVRLVGRDRVLHGLGGAIFDDLTRLLPWTFALLFVLLVVLWRSPLLAGLALVETGLAVVVTMAVLEALGHDVSLMTAMVPILVTVLGVADEIHLFGEFLRLGAEEPEAGPAERARRALGRVFFPCTATTFTTVLGLASFLVTDVPALRLFGLLASVGVTVSWLFTMALMPVVLAVAAPRRAPRWLLADWRPAGRGIFGAGVAVAATLLLVPGVFRLGIDDGWTRNFRPEHRIVRDVAWFAEESVGIYRFDLLLERTDGRRWTEPALLGRLDRLVSELETAPEVTAAASVADLVRDRSWELERAFGRARTEEEEGAPGRSPLPRDPVEVARVLATYRLFNEEMTLRSFLDAPERITRLLVATAGDDYATSSAVRERIDRKVAAAFPGETVRVVVGGSAERGRVLIETVVRSQAVSVTAALVVSLLALGLASGAWRLALRAVGAVAWALALVLGGAGWLGMPLGVASSCFLALGVGVGLDYAIHLAFGARRPGAGGALHARVLANVLVVGVGLAVLGLSSNPTIARLGLLVVASMVAAGYTSAVVFPGDPEASGPPGPSHAPEPRPGGA